MLQQLQDFSTMSGVSVRSCLCRKTPRRQERHIEVCATPCLGFVNEEDSIQGLINTAGCFYLVGVEQTSRGIRLTWKSPLGAAQFLIHQALGRP